MRTSLAGAPWPSLAGLALVAACGGGPAGPWAVDGPVLRTWLESPADAGGILVVQLEVEADAEWDLSEPEVRGLTFQPKGEPRVEQIGERVVLTERFTYGGPEGMYEIPALVATWTGPSGEGTLRSEPIWVDLAVEPPREGELADITEPPVVWTVPWGALSVVGALGMLLAGGLVVAFRNAGRQVVPKIRRLPPDTRALHAWAEACADPGLDDFGKALAISRIFRAYAEEVLGFPAAAWTTSEILVHLGRMDHLPEGNIPRARRLLRATDRVKFADAVARAELFEDLEADLRGFLESTRPRYWDPEEGAA
ncbi:MAG: hypothetical protein JRI25_07620 [Deltaproteobacteria bacterium]|nr:hypothetical protein [Deltaproteobacteria bacterium]